MIKKLCVMSLVVIVLVPAAAQAGRSRTDSGEYNTIVISPEDDSPSASGGISNSVVFTPRAKERAVDVVLEDTSGLPTRAVIGQDLDGDRVVDVSYEICGATEAPVRIHRGIDVQVSAQEGPCEDGTPASATFGTVTVTFTR